MNAIAEVDSRVSPISFSDGSARVVCRNGRPLSRLLCLFGAIALAAGASAATITTNLTISEANTAYDGQDIVIDGAVTVAIDGPHAFNSLLLTNGAVLTHSACTASETHKLDLTVTNEIVVAGDSRIDVSAKGYLPGRTRGNTTIGASDGMSGGSYGGFGGGACLLCAQCGVWKLPGARRMGQWWGV